MQALAALAAGGSQTARSGIAAAALPGLVPLLRHSANALARMAATVIANLVSGVSNDPKHASGDSWTEPSTAGGSIAASGNCAAVPSAGNGAEFVASAVADSGALQPLAALRDSESPETASQAARALESIAACSAALSTRVAHMLLCDSTS